jgi:hypothetical protein
MRVVARMSPHRLAIPMAFVALLTVACNDGPSAPALGRLHFTVQASGGDLDIDGYEFVVDSAPPRFVSSNVGLDADGIQRVGLFAPDIGAGSHSVSLMGVANNCSVSGSNPRSVTVASGETDSVAFTVVCGATGVQISTHTTGTDQPFAYDVQVDALSIPIATNGSQVVSRLQPGPHTITLSPTENCSVAGGVQTTATVSSRAIAPVHFEISCVPVVRMEKIAYVVDTAVGGKAQRMIALVKPDGSGATSLGVGDSPSWSPDGTQLVFTEAACQSYDAYYGSDCGGGLVIADPETRNKKPLSDGNAGFAPAWSPNGDMIAFTRCCAYTDPNRIYLVKPDGSLSAQLTVTQAHSVASPSWSPDGKRIVFVCSDGQSNDLCAIDRSGNGFTRLTSDGSAGVDRPAWRPDGTSIAFTRFPPGTTRPAIFLLDLATGALTRVTSGTGPAWSPDGSRLVFRGIDIVGLFTVDADGSSVTPLTKGAHSEPTWRP